MLPVTHPKALRSPNQIRNTLSAAHQICLCLHSSSLRGHEEAPTCLAIQINSGWHKSQEIDFHSYLEYANQSALTKCYTSKITDDFHIFVTGIQLHHHLFGHQVYPRFTELYAFAYQNIHAVLRTAGTQSPSLHTTPSYNKTGLCEDTHTVKQVREEEML